MGNSSDSIRIDGRHKAPISADAVSFYEKYWQPGSRISDKTGWRNRLIIERLFPQGVRNQRILELGVGGEGGVIIHLKPWNEVHGLDASRTARENCLKLGLDVCIHNLDSVRLPFDDQSFDMVFALEVFEHFASPQFVIEEIRRVLKPEGMLVISTPHMIVYHWPRLFYPELFSSENFKAFLMINDFSIRDTLDLGEHCLSRFYKPGERYWSRLWIGRKLGKNDAGKYFAHGLYFWNRKDERGIRLQPIEAADSFRRCHELAPQWIQPRLLLTRALLYRYVNGDKDEFISHFNFLTRQIVKGTYPCSLLAQYHYAMLYLEQHTLGLKAISAADFGKVIDLIQKQPNAEFYLSKINDRCLRMTCSNR